MHCSQGHLNADVLFRPVHSHAVSSGLSAAVSCSDRLHARALAHLRRAAFQPAAPCSLPCRPLVHMTFRRRHVDTQEG